MKKKTTRESEKLARIHSILKAFGFKRGWAVEMSGVSVHFDRQGNPKAAPEIAPMEIEYWHCPPVAVAGSQWIGNAGDAHPPVIVQHISNGHASADVYVKLASQETLDSMMAGITPEETKKNPVEATALAFFHALRKSNRLCAATAFCNFMEVFYANEDDDMEDVGLALNQFVSGDAEWPSVVGNEEGGESDA